MACIGITKPDAGVMVPRPATAPEMMPSTEGLPRIHPSSAGAFTWLALEWWMRGKPSVLGIISGAVAGLGTITPASGFVMPMQAILIGLVAGAVCFWACTWLKIKLGYDDSLDVFGVHGVGGLTGTLLAGVLAVSPPTPCTPNTSSE